jgi:hypothetical protein
VLDFVNPVRPAGTLVPARRGGHAVGFKEEAAFST